MSEAKVIFGRIAEDGEAPPGTEQQFFFRCPKRGHYCGPVVIAGRTEFKRDGQNQNGGIAQWDWDGNRETPTFTPSVNCSRCWHGYIRGGRCVDTAGVEEPEPKAR